ncbi:glycosyl transferase family 2 [Trypanosoma theileri]|uniref:Glycosyl transferase family 2 n=1 Tax=Trypanosoma theileri TaxID=67003 RepID=A0A1X0NYW5_9TRYP|nr:glycosyl transferase family 2 [Trypanosoma theileri]ORC89877.1 glycosyl transferase family 2 [Trypanosoma theileri]
MNPELFNWTEIPPFIVGGVAFDNWLTTQAVKAALDGVALAVDGTKTLTAIHQNHDKNAFASGKQPKSPFNKHLAKTNGGKKFFRTSHCPCFSLNRQGVVILCRAS